MGYTWIVAGVGWGITVIGWLLSPLISLLLNKFFSCPAYDTSRKLRDLEVHTIPDLKLTLRNAEQQRMLRAAHQEKGSESDLMTLEQLTKEVKSALYEAEDILDLVEYHRIERQVSLDDDDDAQVRASSCLSGAAPAARPQETTPQALVVQCAIRWHRQLRQFRGGATLCRSSAGAVLPISDATTSVSGIQSLHGWCWFRHLVQSCFRSAHIWSTKAIVAARFYRNWSYEAIGIKTNQVAYHLIPCCHILICSSKYIILLFFLGRCLANCL